jgi:NAD(P)-dependent dehydrogenase (short-subunit alcohol dehydrogenase family)
MPERLGKDTTLTAPAHLTSPYLDATLAPSNRGAMNTLKDKVAVVTGGASGIGRALCQAFARAGARVVVADVDEAGMNGTIASMGEKGAQAIAVPTDVSRLADVQALADRAFARWGDVHVLCNNAGVSVHGGLEAATHQDWEWVIGVNLWGVIHGVETFVPRMIAQRGPGHIVNTASMAGLIASQGLGVYNTTKYAVVGLSETLQKDLRAYDIGVSVLCPMGVATAIGTSERNRPAHLAAVAHRPADEIELIGRTLAPAHVADRVLRAVLANQLYIITHDEGLEPLRRRFQRMERAIDESG